MPLRCVSQLTKLLLLNNNFFGGVEIGEIESEEPEISFYQLLISINYLSNFLSNINLLIYYYYFGPYFRSILMNHILQYLISKMNLKNLMKRRNGFILFSNFEKNANTSPDNQFLSVKRLYWQCTIFGFCDFAILLIRKNYFIAKVWSIL